jgi:hypothetical protein
MERIGCLGWRASNRSSEISDWRSAANFIASFESLGDATGKPFGINQRPAVKSLADLDALVVDGGYGKSKLVVINFQEFRGHRYTLADLGGSHMPHVDVNTHGLFVLVQVRRYQEHASIFHETNHRRRREHIGGELPCPHLDCRHINLRLAESGNQSVFHASRISQKRRELTRNGLNVLRF